MPRHPRVRAMLALALAAALLASAGVASAAQAAAEAKLAGTEVRVPKRTRFVAPGYPADALARGLRGIVIVELLIDGAGKVIGAEIIRSIPGLDESALRAVREWEYEPTRVEGKPVTVRLTVPIAFVPKLPELTRQAGIPELRQGALPLYPPGDDHGGQVVLEVTLERLGSVAETSVIEGVEPWTSALERAVRTWRFATDTADSGTLSFRIEARFPARGDGDPPQPEVHLTGLRYSEAMASGRPAPPEDQPRAEAPPAETLAAETEPKPEDTAASTASGQQEPDTPAQNTEAGPEAAAVPEESRGDTQETAEAPGTPTSASPGGEPRPPDGASPSPAPPTEAAEDTDHSTDAGPPIEVLRSPIATPPTPLRVPGYSSVQDVELDVGVPDLVSGRRPVVPPLARLQRATGEVSVRFALNAAGESSVQDVEGPELLRAAARAAVESWAFRRTSPQRLYLRADIAYGEATALARVRLQE